MWRSRLKVPRTGDLEPAHKPEEFAAAHIARREAAWTDLERTMGHDSALRIVEAAEALARVPLTTAPRQPDSQEPRRGAYFERGSYTGRRQEPWETSSPDPNLRLDLWVARELSRAGLPSWLCGVVVRMAMVTMRDGVEVARRTLLEDRSVPESYHFAIDGILKLIPPSI
ncbi:MAG: hypothetical protein ACLQKA_01660 [Bryobacteraceae bacterium]